MCNFFIKTARSARMYYYYCHRFPLHTWQYTSCACFCTTHRPLTIFLTERVGISIPVFRFFLSDLVTKHQEGHLFYLPSMRLKNLQKIFSSEAHRSVQSVQSLKFQRAIKARSQSQSKSGFFSSRRLGGNLVFSLGKWHCSTYLVIANLFYFIFPLF